VQEKQLDQFKRRY